MGTQPRRRHRRPFSFHYVKEYVISRSEIRLAILKCCRQKLATRLTNQICSIGWFPDDWPADEVWESLQEMRRDGVISITTRSRTLWDGFILNVLY
jgi:hypothetical protein